MKTDKIVEILNQLVNAFNWEDSHKQRTDLINAKANKIAHLYSAGEEVYVWHKVKTPYDLPPHGWSGAWRYEGSESINNGNRDALYDNSHLGESVEWLKKLTRFTVSEEETKRLPIVCICGSTRFADYHAIARWLFERDGKVICTMINYLPQHYAEAEFGKGKNDHFGEASGRKDILDELHKRKIDISDAVFVVDIDGYIGESTRSEINYAIEKNIPVYKWTDCEPSFVIKQLRNQ